MAGSHVTTTFIELAVYRYINLVYHISGRSFVLFPEAQYY